VQGVGPLAGSLIRLGLTMLGTACLLIFALAPRLAGLLGAAPADRALFVSFVRWSALASVVTVGPTVLAATLRGWGKAGTAAAVSMTNATVMVSGVAILGYVAGLGVYSVPCATLGSASSGLLLGSLGWRRHGLPAIPWRAWRGEAARRLGNVGAPVAVSYLLLVGSNLGLLWVLGPFGPHVVSGFSAAYTVQTVTIVPAIALGSATAIIMNQLRGQGRSDLLPGPARPARRGDGHQAPGGRPAAEGSRHRPGRSRQRSRYAESCRYLRPGSHNRPGPGWHRRHRRHGWHVQQHQQGRHSGHGWRGRAGLAPAAAAG
jgi:hypothetical protein